MRPRIPVIALASFLAGASLSAVAVPSPQAQSAPVTLVSFMKTPPGSAAEYVQVERELWKPMHEASIRAGNMMGWALYGVRFPGGTERDYGYVTINTFESLDDFERTITDDFITSVHPGIDVREFWGRTAASRQQARTELWTRLESLP